MLNILPWISWPWAICISRKPWELSFYAFTVWESAVSPVSSCGRNACIASPGVNQNKPWGNWWTSSGTFFFLWRFETEPFAVVCVYISTYTYTIVCQVSLVYMYISENGIPQKMRVYFSPFPIKLASSSIAHVQPDPIILGCISR